MSIILSLGYFLLKENLKVEKSEQTNLADNSLSPNLLRIDTSQNFSPIKIHDSNFNGFVLLEKLHAIHGYRLTIQDRQNRKIDDLYIQYPIYRFDACDINNDGKTDILLGVIKTTHFDPILKRRLFIMQIESGKIKPLWLGSRVCQELIDFRCIGNKKEILTIECDKHNLFCNGRYIWHNFGLMLKGYQNENSEYSTALQYFKQKAN